MRIIFALVLAAVTSMPFNAGASEGGGRPPSDFDPTARFIFFSVLEGLYEDGLSNQDVDQILMKKPNQAYFHFIYACPICTPTIWALETYRARPGHFYSLKSGASTFGPGLSEALHRQLYSEDSRQRLGAINTLMQGWMARRMDEMNLSANARAALLKDLEKKRQEGKDVLQSFRKLEHGKGASVAVEAPAYVDLDECAVCNGAVGKMMKLPGDASPTP